MIEYKLRILPWRVYYNVDDAPAEVRVLAVGYKPRETLLIGGQEIDL